MEALGLFDEDVALAAQMRAAEGAKSGGGGGGKVRKRPAADAPPAEPSRRSQRVAGLVRCVASREPRILRRVLTRACVDVRTQGSDGASLDSLQPRDAIRVRQLDHLHAGEAEHYDTRHAGAQRRAPVVGTASYRHTLMRVRTMGEDALARRITAIERAKGKFAVIKMRLFARVLFLEARAASCQALGQSQSALPKLT